MREDQILDRLRRAFAAAWIPVDVELVRDVWLEEIGGLDSVSLVRLIISIETAFAIEISAAENSRLQSIGDVVDLIRTKLGEP